MSRQPRFSNDEASVGGIFTLIAVFLIAGFLFVAIGYAIDQIIMTNINVFGSGTSFSQMRFDVVQLQILAFRAEPIIMLLGLGVNYWINSLRKFSGDISLGVVMAGAIEMIFSTLIIMALTLFGGMGLDAVMNYVNSANFPGADGVIGMFNAVQFVAPAFYGIMMLLTVGTIILFFVLCVQTTDYANQYG